MGAQNIGAHKGVRFCDGAVDMTFRGKMQNRPGLVRGQQGAHQRAVQNVAYDQLDALVALYRGEIGRICGVG